MLLLSFGAHAADLSNLSHSPEWLKLLHYHLAHSGYKSDISNHEFFLAENGATSPQAEIEADYRAFQNHQLIGKSKASCYLPARFQFLQKTAGGLTGDTCPEVEEWRRQLAADSVAVVFSSYFQGAPASMFGHTFLKFNRAGIDSTLNFAIDYAANTGQDNPVVESFRGLLGFYDGTFSALPYFVKIKEYNNAENRDLYEYNLNLNHSEVDFLLLHLWELHHARMRYYFLYRNCSYELLRAIEAAKPAWNLSEHFITHVVPIDTVRVLLEQPDALTGVHYRPSLRRRLRAKWAALPSDARRMYFDVIARRQPPESVQDPLLAEALGLHYTIRQIESKGTLPANEAELAHTINVRRSQLPQLNEEPYRPKDLPRPDLAHSTGRLSAGVGATSSHGGFVELGGRVALHELLERDAGYSPDSQLESFGLRARYFRDGLVFQDFSLLQVLSLTPVDALDHSWSYEVGLHVGHAADSSCFNCSAAQTRIGFGKTMNFGKVTTYALAGAETDFAGLYEHQFRYGPGARAGVIVKPTDRYKLIVDGRYVYFLNQNTAQNLGVLEVAQGYAWTRSTETHLHLLWAGSQFEFGLTQQIYF